MAAKIPRGEVLRENWECMSKSGVKVNTMKEIGLINRNTKYYIIWATWIIQVDLTKEKVISNHENIYFFTVCVPVFCVCFLSISWPRLKNKGSFLALMVPWRTFNIHSTESSLL